MNSLTRTLLVLLLAALPALAQDSITVLEQRDLALERNALNSSHRLKLTLAYFKDGGWAAERIVSAVRQSAQILGQCGVVLAQAELIQLDAPERYRYYQTPVSRELARSVPLRKPAIYFVVDTRQLPAFDAEAIGRGNSRTRPELADTVWVTRGTRDLGIALAHELAHVLMDSGEHTDEPGNLMRDETAPENTRLSKTQCARMIGKGSSNGLLKRADG